MSCYRKHVYPFTAIVGQEKMKLSLILNAINPNICGVLIRGEKGTAKSTVVRALADLLPEIEVVEGCRYSCDPNDTGRLCPECQERVARGEEIKGVARKMRVVTLPINATQDRVAGTLDIEHAIKKGEKRFEPGILAEANRGILYVDEVNLLGDHIVDILLDSAAMGVNVVEREGVSYSHPAHFILVGTMNPEEGELRPQLLDRFGLCVDVEGIKEPGPRMDVVKRRIDYERDPRVFCERWNGEQRDLSIRIIESSKRLRKVTVPDGTLEMIIRISIDLGVDGHRADIVMMKTASTIAAFGGREEVTEGDVRQAAELVYTHRMRKRPFEEPGQENKISEAIDKSREHEEPDRQGEPQKGQDDVQNENSGREAIFSIGALANLKAVDPKKDRMPRNSSGKRTDTLTSAATGAYVRSEDMGAGETDVAFDATIRAAAPYQMSRDKGGNAIAIDRSDLKKKVREKKTGSTIVFVVDASGSMGARQRMEAAKGAVMSLLIDAYQHRDRVGMVAFRGEKAELLLQPTSSVDMAKKSLESLPTGGRTPLSHGIALGLETLKGAMKTDPRTLPVMVLVTDGKANVSMNGMRPVEEAINVARLLTEQHVTAMVLDTEDDFVNLGLARTIAEASHASYHKLGEISPEGIAGLVKESL